MILLTDTAILPMRRLLMVLVRSGIVGLGLHHGLAFLALVL